MTNEELEALGEAQHKFKVKYKAKSIAGSLLSFVITAGIVAAGVAAVLTFGVKIYRVEGTGMEPEMKNHSLAVGNRLAYMYREPQRGDVIVSMGHVYRIIGLPGENIQLYGGHVYIDGVIADESDYLQEGMLTYPVQNNSVFDMPEDQYFVLCDNRENYDDSRSGWTVSLDSIEARMLFGVLQFTE